MSEIPTMFCLVDGAPIAPERIVRRSVTCSAECAKKLAAMRRAMIDARVCRQCHAPSTPEERRDFQRWRRDRGQLKRGRPPVKPASQAAFTITHVNLKTGENTSPSPEAAE